MLVGARAIILIMNFFFVWNILERFAIVVKFDFSGFSEEQFNKFKEELLSGKEVHDSTFHT